VEEDFREVIDWSQWIPASAIAAAALDFAFREVESWRAREGALGGGAGEAVGLVASHIRYTGAGKCG
jgi:hypothetical protein